MPKGQTTSDTVNDNEKETDGDKTGEKSEKKRNAEDEGEWFDVEKILDELVGDDGQLYYFVRWLGYSPEYDTVEPAKELEHCVDIIATWQAEKESRNKAQAAANEKKRQRPAESGQDTNPTRKKRRVGGKKKGRSSSKRRQGVVTGDIQSDAPTHESSPEIPLSALDEGSKDNLPTRRPNAQEAAPMDGEQSDYSDPRSSAPASGRSKTQPKSKQTMSSSKPRDESPISDDDSKASIGTEDSYMNELKSKNVAIIPTSSSEVVNVDGPVKDREIKEKRARVLKTKSGTQAKSKALKITSAKERVNAPTELREPKSGSPQPKAPHFPFQNVSFSSIKPAKRKPGDTTTSVGSDERRFKRLTMSHIQNIKKKRAERSPDASVIPLFSPETVMTAAAKNMRSGRGYEKAVGNIDTAISLVQQRDQSPVVERKSSIAEKSPQLPPYLPARRDSVTTALPAATKIQEEVRSVVTAGGAPSAPAPPGALEKPRSPAPSLAERQNKKSMEPMSEVDKMAVVGAWSKEYVPPKSQLLRRKNLPNDASRPTRHGSPPREISTEQLIPLKSQPVGVSQLAGFDTQPILTDKGRSWSGELLYSRERASFGNIRLHLPQSSARIKTLPQISRESICISKLLSAQYLNKRWLSASALSMNKPDCLHVDFESKDAEKTLVNALRNTDSVGLALEESCTLVFYFKHNERLRPLFNGNLSSSPIGVALLIAHELDNTLATASPVDDLLTSRRTPYNGILLSQNINMYIPHMRDVPYAIYSPPGSLETIEMESILHTRGAVPAKQIKDAVLIFIHRLYKPCLNYIPRLTEHKRTRNAEILMFGSYLDYEWVGTRVDPVFGSGISKIFPHAGVICFTIDHLLVNPQHIKSILAYNNSRPSWNVVLPISMVEKIDRVEQEGTKNSENTGDIRVAIALLREQMAAKKVLTEEYRLDTLGVNSYMPFMNFLQNRDFETVRRFLLIHPQAVSGGQWNIAGNGIEVYTPDQFDIHFKPTK